MSGREPARAALALDVDLHVALRSWFDQRLLGVVRIGGLVLLCPLFSLDVERLFFVESVTLLTSPAVDLREELAE